MDGLKVNKMSREQVLAAVRGIPAKRDFVWDGKDEDDRPLTEEELQAGMEAYRRSRGRPAGSNKEKIAIRLDKDVLEGLRATGKGWQTRINEVMREWLKQQA